MIPQEGILLIGQSNISLAHQIAIHGWVQATTAGAVPCFGNRYGGHPLSDWTGAGPAYTPGGNYAGTIAYARGQRFDTLGVVFFQGESDATAELVPSYAAKLEALFSWIRNDLLKEGGVLKVLYCLPWKTGAGGAAEGYGNGGPGDQIRAILTARAAAEGVHSDALETSGYARAVDGVHVDEAVCLATSGPAIAQAILGLMDYV